MGLGDLFRRLRGDQRAMPEPDSPEFQRMVGAGSAPKMPDVAPGMPGSEPGTPAGQVAVFGPGSGQAGAVSPEALIAAGVPPEHAQSAAAAYSQVQQAFGGGSHTLNLQGMEGLRDEMRATMREHGVDPDSGVAVDASSMPGLQEALLRVLAKHGVDV